MFKILTQIKLIVVNPLPNSLTPEELNFNIDKPVECCREKKNNNNNCNICQPPYSLISIKETKLEDILQVLSKAALTLKNLV